MIRPGYHRDLRALLANLPSWPVSSSSSSRRARKALLCTEVGEYCSAPNLRGKSDEKPGTEGASEKSSPWVLSILRYLSPQACVRASFRQSSSIKPGRCDGRTLQSSRLPPGAVLHSGVSLVPQFKHTLADLRHAMSTSGTSPGCSRGKAG